MHTPLCASKASILSTMEFAVRFIYLNKQSWLVSQMEEKDSFSIPIRLHADETLSHLRASVGFASFSTRSHDQVQKTGEDIES